MIHGIKGDVKGLKIIKTIIIILILIFINSHTIREPTTQARKIVIEVNNTGHNPLKNLK